MDCLEGRDCGAGFGWGVAAPFAGFAPGVFIDNAMRLVFASALSTCTFTIWPDLDHVARLLDVAVR